MARQPFSNNAARRAAIGWRIWELSRCCRIVNELPKSEYFHRRGDKLARKTVRWFLMEAVEKEGERDHEIDETHWLPVGEALERLSYEGDRGLVEALKTDF